MNPLFAIIDPEKLSPEGQIDYFAALPVALTIVFLGVSLIIWTISIATQTTVEYEEDVPDEKDR